MPLIRCGRCGEYTYFSSVRRATELRCRKCGWDLLSSREAGKK